MWKKLFLLSLMAIVLVAGCSKVQSAYSAETKVYAYIPDASPPSGAIRGSGIGQPAPDFRYFDSEGKLKSLSDLRGKPVLLNFWASWCPPCRAEMPILESVYQEQIASGGGVQFLTVSIDEDPTQAQQFMLDNRYTFPFVLDVRHTIGDAYDVYTIPSTFFIDKDGVIKARKIGAFQGKAELENVLKR